MREAERVTPAPQMGGSAGEGLCLVTSPLAAPMPASSPAPTGGPRPGDGISLPRPLPEGPRRTMRSLVKEITSKLPSHLGRVRIRSVLLQSDLFFTFSFNSIFFFKSQCSASSLWAPR